MRVKIRDVLDLEQPINVKRLSPIMKIYAGIMVRWRESASYKRKLNKSLEAEAIARMKKDEQLKQMLLAQIHRELNNNTILREEGKVCKSIIISVAASHNSSLTRVLKHKDFLPYEIRRVPETEDFRKAFKDMPYLIEVSKKFVQGVVV